MATKSIIIIAMLTGPAIGATQSKAPTIEPEAIAALEKMGAYLRAQQSFTIRTNIETDYVLESGQTVRLGARGELRVRRPDHLRAELVSDRKQRQYFYDGKTFTVYGPQIGYYARIAAPPTLLALADDLEDHYGLELPMVDLFRWGSDQSSIDEITSAAFVGTERIDGVPTDHYAFRQAGVDWQIWIQQGASPVPRRLLLITTDDPARPQRSVEMTWMLGTRHTDAEFAFVPPKDATRIEVAGSEEPHAALTP